jgi:class 3 adenylate cyclase
MGPELASAFTAMVDMVEQERPNLAPMASPEGTVTIMFTDMEASTATNEALGDDRFLPALLQHNKIVEDHTRSMGGTVVKSQGDGFMLAFPTARRGVECAIAVQKESHYSIKRSRCAWGFTQENPSGTPPTSSVVTSRTRPASARQRAVVRSWSLRS